MSEHTVALVSKSRRTHVIVLDHEVFREKRYGFTIGHATVVDTSRETGTKTHRRVRRALAGSVTLHPGERIEGLHPAIERVPQVRALLAHKPPLVAIVQSTPQDASGANPSQDDQQSRRLARKRAEPQEG